jgi:ABC-type Fe3+/spermidine/putrescine transport system ATPase subunit
MLTITRLTKRFGATVAVEDLSLTVEENEIVCLLGPSGCGKTTLLRLIAGLETADVGAIHLDGEDLAGVPVHQRNLGFMFQDFALFPHKNVFQNVAFGLQMAKMDTLAIDERVREVLTLVGLANRGERRIETLSGGEQQRVALARSLAPSPRLLLLDEPLGSLDRALRERLMNELRAILKRIGVTAITVTHDQSEAFALADRIVVMDAGRVLQVGTPEKVYRNPASPAVARFLGLSNLLPGEILPADPMTVHTDLGSFKIAERARASTAAAPILLLRPEAATVCPTDDTIPLEATLVACSFRGRHYQITVAPPAGPTLTFVLRAEPSDIPAVGESMRLHIDLNAISLIPSPDRLLPLA